MFFPINVGNYHWCLGVLDLPNWNLVIFDSLQGSKHDQRVLYAVNPLVTMMYEVLDSCGYFTQTPKLAEKKKFKMSCVELLSYSGRKVRNANLIFLLDLFNFFLQNHYCITMTSYLQWGLQDVMLQISQIHDL